MASVRPIVLALTGSIGMGKSAATKQFRRLGVPVFDADAVVHALYDAGGGAVEPIRRHFPGVVVDGRVDRVALSREVLGPSGREAMRRIEAIVHPLVASERQAWFERTAASWLVVLDIPLFYEGRAKAQRKGKEAPPDRSVDCVAVVSASAATQRRRVLARSNMTVDKFEMILKKQVPDARKRELCDFLIDTDFPGFAESRAQIASVIAGLADRHPERYRAWCTGASYGRTTAAARAVTFDLDETLFPVRSSVLPALVAFEEHVQRHLPAVAAKVVALGTTEGAASDPPSWKTPFQVGFLKAQARTKQRQPLIVHDLTEVRRCALEGLIREDASLAAGLGGDAGVSRAVDDAVAAFLKARRRGAEEALFEGVAPMLLALKETGVKVGVVSDGNCDLSSSRPDLFDFAVNPASCGAAKPSIVPFLAAAHAAGCLPCEMLHVGDLREKDVVGATRAGCRAIWFRREGGDGGAVGGGEGEGGAGQVHVVGSIPELRALLMTLVVQEGAAAGGDHGEEPGGGSSRL